MVYALHKFKHYMLGNKIVFYIDCVTLVYLVKKTHFLAIINQMAIIIHGI
jgi:hypothetical protein